MDPGVRVKMTVSPGQWRRAVSLTLESLVHIKTSPSSDTLFLFGGLRTGHRSCPPIQKTPNRSTNMAKTKGRDTGAAAVSILQMCIRLHSVLVPEHQKVKPGRRLAVNTPFLLARVTLNP